MNVPERIKIVYLIGTLRMGGAERDVVETATRLNKEVFAPQIYCVSGGGPLQQRVKHHGIPLTIFQSKRSFCVKRLCVLPKFFSLLRYLQREQPDIVHSYTYSPSIYGGIAAKLVTRAKMITNRLCLGKFKDGNPLLQVLENLVNSFTDNVVVNARAIQADVLRRERIAADKIQLVYNGVNCEHYTPVDQETRQRKKQEFGFSKATPIIAMIANISPYKGHREFMLAAAEVVKHVPDVRFLCIGEDRGLLAQVQSLIQRLGLDNHVIFTGLAHDVSTFFPLIDIQVSASYEEGFSNAILEGMASGKPIIATNVGGSPEAVIPQETGLLVPPADDHALAQAMLTLLTQPELAARLGRQARQRVVENFSVQKMVTDLETLYSSLSKSCIAGKAAFS